MALITKGGTRQIRTNLNESELQSGSWSKGFTDAVNSFELSDNTLDAWEYIRLYYNTPISIRSTYRSDAHNSVTPGAASGSKHLLRNGIVRALDFRFVKYSKKGTKGYLADKDFYKQMTEKTGPLYDVLTQRFNIRGIGLYDTFYHIDDRIQSRISEWDNSTKKKSYIEAITSTYNNNEDGYLDWQNSLIIITVLLLIITIGAIIYFKQKK